MTERVLVIGNKNYSSWSLRAWIGLSEAGVAFREQVIKLDRAETAAEIARWSPAGRVPVLVDDGLTVHDSLAILEYVNETCAGGALWPADSALRARARAASAEMHAGFASLRARLPMNLARPPGPPGPQWALDAATRAEIGRIVALWEALLADSGGPFLCGAWSIADCMYLPVATRFHTYAVALDAHPAARDYAARLLALPSFLRFQEAARAEPERLLPYDR
jgi:glutathione S-transferase